MVEVTYIIDMSEPYEGFSMTTQFLHSQILSKCVEPENFLPIKSPKDNGEKLRSEEVSGYQQICTKCIVMQVGMF